jgi:hypothetical protein
MTSGRYASAQPFTNSPTASADIETSPSRRDTNAVESAERGWIERVLEESEAAPSLDHRVIPGIAHWAHDDPLVSRIALVRPFDRCGP